MTLSLFLFTLQHLLPPPESGAVFADARTPQPRRSAAENKCRPRSLVDSVMDYQREFIVITSSVTLNDGTIDRGLVLIGS